ncbi:glycosyltransferase, partial [Candidatus Uhrbacteria bacterium]|nr:glycosyltransferase [Candidatus Uhrbacteria bacterium]
MRIAVLTNAYPPKHRGGAGRIAELQVEMLRAEGHDVRVWSPEIAWLQKNFFLRGIHHVFDFVAKHLAQEISDWKPEVLLTHNLTGCGFATPCAIKRRTRCRWVHVLHDMQLFEPSGQSVNANRIIPWQLLLTAMRRPFFQAVDVIISPTQWLIDQHTRRGFVFASPIKTIMLPNPAPRVSSGETGTGSAERVTHQPMKLLFAGGDSKAKGGLFLTELEQAMTIPFILERIGNGSVQGVLDSAQVLEKMKEADVLLVPSMIEENQPTVILEAASVGLPVIASNKAGIVETLAGAGKALPLKVEAWKQEIEALSKDKEY